MPYVNVHGVNLYYEEYGKGPAVLLTPVVGWTGTGCVPWLRTGAEVPRHPARSPQLWAL